MDLCPQPARRETKDCTARSNIEECLAVQILNREHFPERVLGLPDFRTVQPAEESTPILSKLKSLSASDLSGVRVCDLAFLDIQGRFHALYRLAAVGNG